jgi:hypothetical protein
MCRKNNAEKDWESIKDVVEKIVKRSINKHTFGYFDKEDIAQEIRLICYEAHQHYNPDRGKLEHFLATSVANRLHNLKRDNSYILPTPCVSYGCEFYNKQDRGCMFDKSKCLDWKRYELSYKSKMDIIHPVSMNKYPNDNVESEDSSIKLYVSDMISIANERGEFDLCEAMENFIQNDIPIPQHMESRVKLLASEVI